MPVARDWRLKRTFRIILWEEVEWPKKRGLHNENRELEYVAHCTPRDQKGYFRNSDTATTENQWIPAVLAKGVAHAEQGARDAEA